MSDTTSAQPRFEGAIVGRIRRAEGIGRNEAFARAQSMPWFRPGLVFDGRDRRFFVFREPRRKGFDW